MKILTGFFASLALILCACGPAPKTGEIEPLATFHSNSCGYERWPVKTGTDSGASQINLSSVTSTTIGHLDSLPNPGNLSQSSRIPPTETTVYQVKATLTAFKEEPDSDYHLILQDAGNSMIAEIPFPGCVGSGSPFLPGITLSRNAFNARFTVTGSFTDVSVPVTVTGVGFFDFNHGQTGVAPNAIEIHPVLSITFGAGPTPSPSPTRPSPSPTRPGPSPSPTHHPGPSPSPTSGCFPRASTGNCYEPGEFCPHADAGMTGVAGDGKVIVCMYNDGLRWEPVSDFD